MARYFEATNATRPIKAGGFSVQFEVVSTTAGTSVGVYQTPSEEEADALKASGRVFEISEEEYQRALQKKKTPSPSSQSTTPTGPAPRSAPAVTGSGKPARSLVEIDAEPPPPDPLAGVGKRAVKKRGQE